jgi:hypothetical protein
MPSDDIPLVTLARCLEALGVVAWSAVDGIYSADVRGAAVGATSGRGLLLAVAAAVDDDGMGEDELAACCAAMETWHSASGAEGERA